MNGRGMADMRIPKCHFVKIRYKIEQSMSTKGTKYIRALIATGYLLIALLVGGIIYTWLGEWRDMERQEAEARPSVSNACHATGPSR